MLKNKELWKQITKSGYARAIHETRAEDGEMKSLYATMIAESHRIRLALGNAIQAYHGELSKGTSSRGKIYSAWMGVKSALTGHDRQDILESCEYFEDAVQKAYSSAMEDRRLPAYLRELISQQQRTLRSSHDEIRSLRDQYA
jgi:uncharacterized protein (TIGR02284 family)